MCRREDRLDSVKRRSNACSSLRLTRDLIYQRPDRPATDCPSGRLTLSRSSLTSTISPGRPGRDDRCPFINRFQFIVDFCRQIIADKLYLASRRSGAVSSLSCHQREIMIAAQECHNSRCGIGLDV